MSEDTDQVRDGFNRIADAGQQSSKSVNASMLRLGEAAAALGDLPVGVRPHSPQSP